MAYNFLISLGLLVAFSSIVLTSKKCLHCTKETGGCVGVGQSFRDKDCQTFTCNIRYSPYFEYKLEKSKQECKHEGKCMKRDKYKDTTCSTLWCNEYGKLYTKAKGCLYKGECIKKNIVKRIHCTNYKCNSDGHFMALKARTQQCEDVNGDCHSHGSKLDVKDGGHLYKNCKCTPTDASIWSYSECSNSKKNGTITNKNKIRCQWGNWWAYHSLPRW